MATSSQQASALGWSLLGDLSRQGVTFAVSVVLARLLSPADFGLVGMAMAFIVLLNLLVDSGFTVALIQRKEASGLVYDSVFYYNLALAFLVAGALFVSAPAIARFYAEPRVIPLVRWLALTVPVSALGLVPQAILRRDLAFKALGLRTFLGGLIGGIVGMAMAWLGYGVFALVGQTVTGAVVSVIALYLTRRWWPAWRFSWPALREVSVFGRYIFFGQVVSRGIGQSYSLLIGKFFDSATLGFYTRAESLNRLVIQYSSAQLTKVYMPVLSRLQDERARFDALFLRVIGLSAWAAFLLTGVLLLAAEWLIVTLFGAKWAPAIPIFQVLMFRAFAYPVNAMIVNAYLSRGLSRLNFRNGMIRNVFRAAPLLVAWLYGFEPFLYALVATTLLGTLLNNWLASRQLDISLWEQLVVVYRWLFVGAAAYVPAWLALPYLRDMLGGAAGAKLVMVAMSVTVYVVVYLAVSYFVAPAWVEEVRTILHKLRAKLSGLRNR